MTPNKVNQAKRMRENGMQLIAGATGTVQDNASFPGKPGGS
ncbi:hypothetical protein RQCS_62080 (plasmid) [Rhodococcus qingshengii]|nr:hypothetical protein [Rhodococcus qingshengii]BCF86663.1 hypothetical protein RQCS_62080 [Rhodococcus qingshengii]